MLAPSALSGDSNPPKVEALRPDSGHNAHREKHDPDRAPSEGKNLLLHRSRSSTSYQHPTTTRA